MAQPKITNLLQQAGHDGVPDAVVDQQIGTGEAPLRGVAQHRGDDVGETPIHHGAVGDHEVVFRAALALTPLPGGGGHRVDAPGYLG